MTPPTDPDVWVETRGVVRRSTLAPAAAGAQFDVRLAYFGSDPFAAWFVLHEVDGPKGWVVSRDVLVAGVDDHAGVADVRVWPLLPARERVVVALSSNDGEFVFDVPGADVVRFLRAAFRLVPRGREDVSAAVDAAIGRMLPEGWVL